MRALVRRVTGRLPISRRMTAQEHDYPGFRARRGRWRLAFERAATSKAATSEKAAGRDTVARSSRAVVPRRSRRLASLTATIIAALVLSVPATPVLADGRPWYSALDSDYVNRGLGFLREFREPGRCKDNVDEMAGAMTSMSPETWGGAIGLAIGAAAGAASTRSVMGALRGGLLMGSIGSALGHLADVFLPERMADLADDLQDLIQERDGRVCELLRASDKLRTPVVEHLGAALEQECGLQPEPGADATPSLRKALRRCLRENRNAARILEEHSSVLTTINAGTCKIAAAVVNRFARIRAGKGERDRQRTDNLLPNCVEPLEGVEEVEVESVEPARPDRAPPGRSHVEQIL